MITALLCIYNHAEIKLLINDFQCRSIAKSIRQNISQRRVERIQNNSNIDKQCLLYIGNVT